MLIDRGILTRSLRRRKTQRRHTICRKSVRSFGRAISSPEVLEERIMLSGISVGDRVWFDWNNDGTQNPNEAGPSGVAVELYDSQSQLVTTTNTGTDGFYSFNSAQIVGGQYSIRVIPPQGMGFTRPDVGSDDALDSDVEPSTARSPLFQISDGQTRTDIDVGLVAGTLPDTPNVVTPPPRTNDPTPQVNWDIANRAATYEVLVYNRDSGQLLFHQNDLINPMFTIPAPLDVPGSYQAFVRSIDSHGFSGNWSAPQNFSTVNDGKLDRPQFLAPVGETSDSTPELRWNEIEGRASYELMLFDKSRGQLVVQVDRLTAASFTPSSPLVDSQYQAFVKAISGNGPDSDWSLPHEFSVNTGTQTPDLPFLTGPRGRIDDNTPTISWDVANGADSYELLVYNVQIGQQVVHETQIVPTSFTIENPLVNARYQVFLRSSNNAGSSSWTSPMEFEVFVTGAFPEIPLLNLPNRVTDDSTPTIVWTNDGKTEQFELLVYNLNLGQPAIHEKGITLSEFTTTQQLADAPYQAFVRGSNSVGTSNWSDALFFNVQTGSPPPVPPVFIGPTGRIDDNTPSMTWTTEANTDTYELLVYNLNLGQEAIHETLLQDATFTQPTALPDASYQGFVRGFNQTGQSPWSVPVVFEIKTTDDPPPAPTITSPSGITDDSTPTVTWTDVATAETYELLVYNIDKGQQVVHETGLSVATYDFTATLKDATYQAFVRGQNSGGPGAWSSPGNFDFRSGTSGQTDANGVVKLNLLGKQLSFELVHGTTEVPLANLGVGLALDPEVPGLGVLTVVDPTGQLPTQTIVLQGSGENTNGLSALNEKVVVEGTVKGVLKSFVTAQLPKPVEAIVGEVEKVSDAAGLALKYVNLQFGLPALPSDQRENLTPEEAVSKINQDLKDKLATHVLVLTATGGADFPAAAYGSVIDVLNWGADRFTVSVADDIPSAGIVKVTRKTPFGTFITYEVGSLPSNLPPWGVANFTADGKDERGLPLPPGTSLELVSKGALGLSYDVVFQSNGQASVAVPIGRYDATVRLFGQEPKNVTIDVPANGSNWNFTFQPPAGVTVTPTAGLTTFEDQAQPAARFTVKLNSPPTADVVILFVSSDTSEGTILSPNVRFTSQNWNQEQEVLIKGVDDGDLDQNQAYTIFTSGAISDDPRYQGLGVPDVTLTNVDNEEPLTPPGNVTGTWRGTSRQCNSLGCQNFNTTIIVKTHFPQFSTVITGTIFSGSGSRTFFGTVSQDTNRLVINVDTAGSFFFRWQMTGTVTASRMKGDINILDRSGGRTTGTFNLTKTSGLEVFDRPNVAPASVAKLTADSLLPVFDAAKQQWRDAGLDRAQQQILQNIEFGVANLPGTLVGRANGESISLDEDAAGLGWFVDSTPFINEEFDFSSISSTFVATAYSPAENRIDLLTVVMHEIGHVLGYDHTERPSDLMAARLELGVRKLPNYSDIDRIFQPKLIEGLFRDLNVADFND